MGVRPPRPPRPPPHLGSRNKVRENVSEKSTTIIESARPILFFTTCDAFLALVDNVNQSNSTIFVHVLRRYSQH